jgi:hypothetical protein
MDFIYKLLIEKRDSLLIDLEEVNALISERELKGNNQVNNVSDTQVKSKIEGKFPNLANETDVNKLLLILKDRQQFMRVREIGKIVSTQLGEEEKDWVVKLSRTTRHLKELNKITKVQVGNSLRNSFWGSPKWLNSDGTIKSEHMYSEEKVDEKPKANLLDL